MKFIQKITYFAIGGFTLGVLAQNLQATSIDDFIDKSKCDQVLDKKYFNICYSYKYKGLLAGWTRLEGDKVYNKNIKKRPRFYEDQEIPKRYRSKYSDYTGTGHLLNRGHAVISDASLDYDKKALKSCYVMSNIFPQAKMVNKKTWIKAEKYGRKVASKLGYLNSITIVNYKKYSPKTIKNNVAIPLSYYRIYYNDDANFKKCFYYENDINVNYKADKLKQHIVNCDNIKMK